MATRLALAVFASLLVSSPFSTMAQTPNELPPPHGALLQQATQIELTRIQLEGYRNELEMFGIGQELGLGKELSDESIRRYNSWLKYYAFSLRNIALNTFNFGRLLFTGNETRLLDEWRVQSAQLDHTIAALKIAYDIMGERDTNLQNAFAIADSEPKYAAVRTWVNKLKHSQWAQDVMFDGTLPMRPVLPSDLGLYFRTDFIDEDWKTLLAEQGNIVNVYIFWRGAAAVSTFGQSSLGRKVAETLRLNKLVDAIKKLPKSLQGPTLWMIYETADGCTIRYFQVAYVAAHHLGRTDFVRVTRQLKRFKPFR